MSKVLGLVMLFSSLVLAEENGQSYKLFHIERSKNKNQVHYNLLLNDKCEMKSEFPVVGFWQDLELGPDVRNNLTFFDKVAYGIEKQMVNKNEVLFKLRPLKDKEFKAVATIENGKCKVEGFVKKGEEWKRGQSIF